MTPVLLIESHSQLKTSLDCSSEHRRKVSADLESQPDSVPHSPPIASTHTLGVMLILMPMMWIVIITFFAAWGAFDGFLCLTLGHVVLQAAHRDGYGAPLASSMNAGAMGGSILRGAIGAITLPVLSCMGEEKRKAWKWSPSKILGGLLVSTALATAAGPIGVAILRGVGTGDTLDPTNAAQAGALGSVIASFIYFAFFSFLAVFGMICTQVCRVCLLSAP
ncbi:hypothetical protein BV22DRAFT_1130816 [Leucogyrophana mollusca]|uniref:Uncharacterized protein n=1 Tax=Leucogyrophana mollusca TaxID=85980 RepID=A0ACB8BEJ4_9AGAM|nr:hypothetical protein BV22DRAFT_1130816 [Leucogyrophana mollusca]